MNKISGKLLLFLLCMPASLLAQQAIVVWDTTALPSMDLDEIEIRASRQNTSVKKLPASVSIISGQSIQVNEVQSLKDISAITPGFFMPDYGSRLTSPVYIRGIGSRINSPSVGLYVDRVPYFEKAAFDFDFFDVESIEVLKGPQGTLYGRNTMGGIINVTTKSPFDHQGTSLFISGGTHGNLSANAGHYNKLGEAFAYSLSINYRHRDGYYINTFSDERVDWSNSAGFRSRLEWKITDRISLENIASAEWSEEGGYPYALITDSTRVAPEIHYNMPGGYERRLFSDALVASYKGKRAEVISTTAFQYLDDLQSIDQDFTADSAYFVDQDQEQHMLSQELIARSAGDRRLKWLFGAYGFFQQFDKQVDVEMFQHQMTLFKDYEYRIAGAALFHQTTIGDFIIDGLSLTAGIRVDAEQNVLDYRYDREMGETTSVLMDTVFPSLSYIKVLPKIAFSYQAGSSNIYAVIANGYKTGGFNSTFYRDEELFFEPEESWNYEVGVKTSLFDRTLYADLSLFYIDWNNQQIYQTAHYDDGTPAPGSFLSNAGESVSTGGEISLKSIPLKGFSPVLSYGFTHAVFTSHVIDGETDLSGNYIPYVPRHTLTFQLQRNFMLKENKIADEVGFNLLYRGLGRIYWNEENSFSTGFYHLADAKIILKRRELIFEIWGKNLLNSSYESFYFQAIGNQYVQTGKPVRFGLNLKFSF